MSETRDVQIQGDGNAVGDNNRILVDKRSYTKITPPSSGSGGGGNNKSKSDDGSWVVGIGLAFLIAVATATWKFAFYANAIYTTLIWVALILAASQVTALAVGISSGVDTIWVVKRALAFSGTVLLGVAVYWSRAAYPNELSLIAARVTDWKDFMCHLSVDGHQVATLHMTSMCFLAIPCSILLGANSVGGIAGSLFFVAGWQWSGRLAIQFSIQWILVVASVLSVAAFFSQSSTAYNFWRDTVLTKEHNPFSRDGKGFNFCRSAS